MMRGPADVDCWHGHIGLDTVAHHLHGRQLRHDGVREHSNLQYSFERSRAPNESHGLAFLAFRFFKSMPTSRVTPSPKRRSDAAT